MACTATRDKTTLQVFLTSEAISFARHVQLYVYLLRYEHE